MPPWMAGCRVFTRPSMISGKPVTSEMPVMGSPALPQERAVPPVEMTSTPSSTSPRTNGSRSRLVRYRHQCPLDLHSLLLARRRSRRGPIRHYPAMIHFSLPGPPAIPKRAPDLAGRDQPDGRRQQLVLHGVDALRQAVHRVALFHPHRLLGDDGPGVRRPRPRSARSLRSP